MVKASKLVSFLKPMAKTKVRWFELDGDVLKNLHFSDNTTEGCTSIASITEIRPQSSQSAITNESKFHFELETTTGQSMAFGCSDAAIKDHWLTALNFALGNYLISKSSYKRRLDQSDRFSVSDVINFADQFKKQGALYTTITNDRKQISIDEHGFDDKDVNEVSQYLQNLMMAAGLNGKLLQIFHEFVLIAPADGIVWDAIHNGLRKIRKQMRNNNVNVLNDGDSGDIMEDGFELDDGTSSSFTSQLRLKGHETGSIYSEVNRLAMIAVSKEQENIDLKDRIRKFEEQYLNNSNNKKKLVTIDEAVEQMKIKRMQSKIKELEEFFVSDQTKIEKLNERIREFEDEIEDLKNKHTQEIKKLNS
jgi:hypothetical protein